MGKQRNSYDGGFKQMYDEVMSGNISDKTKKIFKDNPLNQNTYENDEINLKNQDYLKGDENPYTYQGGLDLNQNDPFNEIRANNQSALDHLGIGAVRTVAKATTEVLKLPGVIGGIAMSPFADENEGFETAFNNQWIKFFDGLNEDVKESLPVYIKESVKNGDFFTKIGSSATWATEGADGAGYMLGALAPGAIFKFAGGAGALFGASIKAAKLAKYGENIQAAGKFLEKAGITIKNIDQYMIPAFNTLSEAGAESKGVWDGMESRRDDAHKEYMRKLDNNDPRYQKAISLRNEEIDQLRRSGEISLEESQELYKTAHIDAAETMFEKDFKEQKALAAQNSFFKNVVWLAGPNYIQAKLLFGKTPSKVLLDKIGGLGEKSIKNTFKQGAKNFVKGFASEGAEEVGQSAVEHRNIEQGLKFKLGDSRWDDYNPLTFGEDFIKTLGTTDGQMAGFLGGIMGAPTSAVGGYFQDKSDRKQTERLREKINGASTAYADIKNTNIYEQEEYTNPETGEVSTRDKEVDGKKVFIPEAVAKVKKALDLVEKDSNEYDNAIEDGDTERIEQFRNQGEFNVITNFIGEDEVTLDALHEHLKVAFPTETSKDLSDDQVKVNKTNMERIDKIMAKAKHLQKDLVSFKDMSTSILRINHPDITSTSTKEEKKAANEHLEDFLNRVGNTFLSERAEEYEAKQTLNKLEKQQLELENNSTVIEIDNPNYIEGVSSEFDKKTKTRSNNPRLELVNSLIDKVKEKLKGYEENTNNNIWNNELLNKQFAEEVKEINGIKKENTTEQVAKNDEVLDKTKNATTVDEIKEIEKTSPKETIENPVIKEQIDNKKAELKKAKEDKESEVINNAKEDDNAFNGTSKTQTYSTEGSDISDELTPKTSENTTTEEDKEAKTIDPTQGKGVKLISYDRKNGEVLSFIKEQFPEGLTFERNPVNKIGTSVGFEINENPTGDNSISEIEKRRQEELNVPDRANILNAAYKAQEFFPNETREELEKRLEEEIDHINLLVKKLKEKGISDEKIIKQIKDYISNGNRVISRREGVSDFATYLVEKNTQINSQEKIDAKYDAEIKVLPQNKSLVSEALAQFKAGNFQNIQLLIDYLPINIKLAEGAYLPIETRRVNGEINPETEMLRKSLITSLINGVPIENMNSNITGQYKGVLQVESSTAENNLLDLSGVDGLKYIKDNTYFVNIHGQLENVLTGQTRAFQNKFTKDLDRTKNYAAGEIYLMVPQADGVSQFPLKLNISKLSIEESEGLFEIYKEILTQDKGSNTTLSEVSPELLSVIENIFGEQLKIITTPNKIKDIKLGEIIDLLVHESDKPKSRINITDGVLYFGENGTANSSNIDELKEEIMYFLHTQKRHQIKIRPKTAEDNQRTNLSSNSANYIKYLVEGKILSTNAVVNEPLFQGYTNLFISPIVTIKGSETKKSNIDNINNKVEEIVNRGEPEKIYRDHITKEDRNKKIDFDSLMSNISKSLSGEKEQELLEANKLLKQYLKEIHPDKIQNSNNKKLSETITTAMIIVAKKGDISKLNELYELYNKSSEKSAKKIKEYTETEIEDRLKGIRTVKELADGFKTLSKEQQDLYKPLFTEKRIQIEDKGKVKVSDAGAETDSKNWEGLDFGENKSQNTRNVENNSVSLPESTTVIKDLSDSNKFVSSSDIPNTVENKQQVEKQNDVFEAAKGKQKQFHLSDMKSLLNREESQLTDKQKQDLENYKKAYPDEYKKHCK